jgi:hypothetical protein
MARRVIQFHHPYQHSFGADMMLVIAAIASAVAVFFLIFVFVKYSGLVIPRPVYEGGPLRGLQVEKVLYEPGADAVRKDVIIERMNLKSGSAFRGQEDVSFFKYSLTPRWDSKLHKLAFSFNGKARPDAITGLQLYVNDEFIVEKPFFEGRADFEGLNIDLFMDESLKFEVMGKINENAISSDRIQLGLLSREDIEIKSGLGETLYIAGSGSGDFPVWGRYVSVIGSKK